ncbi:uncharacterized protein LOC121731232 [Aricia agestis]|uniref:uncharacterized protein LOC121731232 n=1 Tax=Aricia agestis TaxID=91739 RepID=UPI001C2079BD|nr:uncharacterized protein LOC121731232 [Aricia agestis]
MAQQGAGLPGAVPPPPTAASTVQAPSGDLAAITLTSKIPEFWTDAPRIWFIRVEAMLAPQKLADDSRFDIVVSKLSKDAIQQVSDLLTNPPATKKFDSLKQRLLAIYEESESRQLQKLISEMDLGDQKPSQLLRRMRELAKGKVPDDTLKILWQGHLPPQVRAVLAVSDTKDLDNLAAVADKVFETTRAVHVSEVASQPSSTSSRDTDLLMAEIAKISRKLAGMAGSQQRYRRQQRFGGNRSRSASRKRTRDPTPSTSRRNPESPDWLCFYHHRFRSRAHKCVEPCAWKPRADNN